MRCTRTNQGSTLRCAVLPGRGAASGAHPVDSLVKTLAGDFCCYQTADAFPEDEARTQVKRWDA